ncbi:hypothetical protein KP509_04G036400 [Ceratopteris richardii]|uniref:Bet v I/Major latex protein domain-containing protein n=1 Tax=Ceratopteris richardii TaxID=49495 RepID=A0A8T2UW16_CERRI|nr:hypothetical protein KP509_04G036400 [Ceratopteris richardii]
MEVMEFDIPVQQPAELVWQSHIKNFQVTLPAANPGHYKKVEYTEGPPLAAGGVVKIHYVEEFGHYDYIKFRWDVMDHDNYYCKLTIFDGGFISKKFASLVYHYSVTPSSDNLSCTMVWKIEYDDLEQHDCHDILKEELTKFSNIISAHIDETIK